MEWYEGGGVEQSQVEGRLGQCRQPALIKEVAVNNGGAVGEGERCNSEERWGGVSKSEAVAVCKGGEGTDVTLSRGSWMTEESIVVGKKGWQGL